MNHIFTRIELIETYKIILRIEYHKNGGGGEIVKIVFASPLFIVSKVLNQNNVP